MRLIFALPIVPLVALSSCNRKFTTTVHLPPPPPPALTTTTQDPSQTLKSVFRINSTQQTWNISQPWEKQAPQRRRSLGALVAPGQVLTTAEMVADATYLELESPDGRSITPATVTAVDYEANLALITAKNTEDPIFKDTIPLAVAPAATRGTSLDIFQVEENGTPLVTSGNVQTIDVSSSFLPGQFFLTYEVKASMQSAASSFSLPVLRDGQLAGILSSYNAEDQISDIIATDIVASFVKKATSGQYAGFPSLGISISRTDDPNFRQFLKLPADGGGLYVSSVRKGSAADKAGLAKGDVILRIDQFEIDRLGYFDDPHYGRLFWSHLVRGAKSSGDQVTLQILRNGEPKELTATLDRRNESDQVVPAYTFDTAPNYLVKGGLVFQELTRPILESYGSDWTSRAPLNLLNAYENPEPYEEKVQRIVFLAGVIATPATVGYEPLRSLIVTRVNGKEIRNMKSLVEAFETPGEQNLHAIEFQEEQFKVYLDETLSSSVDAQFLQRGLSRLSRTGP